jgi:dTMP kinase
MGRSAGGPRLPAPVALPATSSTAVRGLLASRPFRRVALATAASSLGDWLGFLAIIALTADIMGPTRAAAFAVSGVLAARVLPSLVLAPIAGVLVDRADRKRVLVITDVGRGVIMALIPFTQEVLALVLATLFIEALSSMFAPAKDAVYPTLVRREQLVTANQINLGLTYGMLPVAGLLYAALVAAAGRYAPAETFLAVRPIALPIWINAASFLLSAALFASITIRRAPIPARRQGERALDQFREGIGFVAGHPIIRVLIGGVMIAAATAGVVITTGEFFAGLLNAGPSGFGVLVAAVGIGMLVGLLIAAPLSRRLRPEWLFAPGIIVAGAGLIVTATAATIGAAVVPAGFMGAGAGLVFIVGYTVLQQQADDRIRGRTFGAFNSGVRIAIFIATIVVPLAIGVVGREARVVEELDGVLVLVYPYVFGGIRITLLVAGAVTVVGGLVVLRVLSTALRAESNGGILTTAGGAVDPAGAKLPPRRGLFVAFEGGDGSGKSTQLRLLAAHLEQLGLDVVVTREPGGTAIGERIREVLLDPASSALCDRAEALLYAAARAQHVVEVIDPALEAGKVVLCDRFIDSSVVYQGAGRGLGEQRIEDLNLWATGQVVADLIVLLDVEVGEGLRRAGGAEGHDRLEAAGERFHTMVRAAYRRRADAEPHRYVLLDGRHAVDELQARIAHEVEVTLAPLGLLPDLARSDEPGGA